MMPFNLVGSLGYQGSTGPPFDSTRRSNSDLPHQHSKLLEVLLSAARRDSNYTL